MQGLSSTVAAGVTALGCAGIEECERLRSPRMSGMINNALGATFREDEEDFAVFAERAGEPLLSQKGFWRSSRPTACPNLRLKSAVAKDPRGIPSGD
jgi:hypothetical protein